MYVFLRCYIPLPVFEIPFSHTLLCLRIHYIAGRIILNQSAQINRKRKIHPCKMHKSAKSDRPSEFLRRHLDDIKSLTCTTARFLRDSKISHSGIGMP